MQAHLKQPPSGGCVLKLFLDYWKTPFNYAAAFGRLCVETWIHVKKKTPRLLQPPSGGCVLKLRSHSS